MGAAGRGASGIQAAGRGAVMPTGQYVAAPAVGRGASQPVYAQQQQQQAAQPSQQAMGMGVGGAPVSGYY